jgi:hypothetical protein
VAAGRAGTDRPSAYSTARVLVLEDPSARLLRCTVQACSRDGVEVGPSAGEDPYGRWEEEVGSSVGVVGVEEDRVDVEMVEDLEEVGLESLGRPTWSPPS